MNAAILSISTSVMAALGAWGPANAIVLAISALALAAIVLTVLFVIWREREWIKDDWRCFIASDGRGGMCDPRAKQITEDRAMHSAFTKKMAKQHGPIPGVMEWDRYKDSLVLWSGL
jgi:hypothetical protein